MEQIYLSELTDNSARNGKNLIPARSWYSRDPLMEKINYKKINQMSFYWV